MSWKTTLRSWSVVAVLAALSSEVWAQGLPSSGEREATVKAISNFDPAACDFSDVPAADDWADAWMDEITNTSSIGGHWTSAWSHDTYHLNGTIGESDFTDVPDWGEDDLAGNIDEADAAFVITHGTHFTDDGCYALCVRADESGEPNCYVHQQDMFLGDTDLEFLVLFTCHSMCQANWWGACGWGDQFDRLHQLLGFHGVTYISVSTAGRVRDFVDDSFYGPLASAWLDQMYDIPSGSNNDRCPVARGIGSSASDVKTRQSNEEYDKVYSDPPAHGTPGRSPRVLYVTPCNPIGEPSL